MKAIRSKPLIIAIIAISVGIFILSRLGHYGSFALQTRQIVGFSAFGLNVVIAIMGLRTSHRAAWAVYLGLSVSAFVLISAATPLGTIWTLLVVAYDSLAHG